MVGDDFGNKSGGIRYIPQGCRYHIRFVRFPYPADRARRGILDDHEGNFVLTHQIPVIGACLQDVWTIRARGSSRSERDYLPEREFHQAFRQFRALPGRKPGWGR